MSELNVPEFNKNLKKFINLRKATLFKQYIVNDKKYYKYGGKDFFVIAGFYNNRLQYVIIATEELCKTEKKEEELSNEYLSHLRIKKSIKMWSIGFSILSGYSMIGYGEDKDTYFEAHYPYGRSYLQLTNYRFNKRFFKKLKFKRNSKKTKRNEYIISRKL